MQVQISHMVQQYAEAGDILRIMFQNIVQKVHLLCFQISKISLRYLTSGKHFLQSAQVASSQPQLPQPAAHMQQIKMRQVQAGPVHPVHQKAAFQQRHVKGRPVKGAQHVKPVQSGCYMLQQIWFLRIIPHQKLMHLKSLV